jgi:hypothetical protein
MNTIVGAIMRLLGCFLLNTKLIQTHIVFKYNQLSNRIIFNNRMVGEISHAAYLLSRSLGTQGMSCQTT